MQNELNLVRPQLPLNKQQTTTTTTEPLISHQKELYERHYDGQKSRLPCPCLSASLSFKFKVRPQSED